MKKRPLIIKLLAAGYFITPFSFALQYLYFSHLPILEIESWKVFLDPYKLSFLIIPPIIGYGIYMVHIWGWYLSVIHLSYIIVNNLLAFFIGSKTPAWTITLFSIVTLIVLLTFVRKEIRAPYFNPRMRWWETKPRYRITLGVDLSNDINVHGETFNISESGMFMVSNADCKINHKFNIRLTRSVNDSVTCAGSVVWINEGTPQIPKGFGIRFTKLATNERSLIQKYINDQSKAIKPRYEITLPLKLENDKTKIDGETFDISEGGLFVISPAEVSVGEIFHIQICCAGETIINCDAEVVWLNKSQTAIPKGFGLLYKDLYAKSFSQIKNIIKNNQKRIKESKYR